MQYNRYDPTSTGGTDNTAIFEFDHGLSYTEFGYGDVSVTPPTVGNPANRTEVTVTDEIVNVRQNLIEPSNSDFGFENSLVVDTGDRCITVGGYGAFLEDYEVKHTTLRHPLGLVRQRGQQVLRSALTDLVGEFLCKTVM